MTSSPDPEGRSLYRAGGISALVVGVAYMITIALFAQVGAPPSSGESWLKYLVGKTTQWWIITGLSVFTDFLFVPVGLALYVALKGVNRNAMLVATAFVAMFVAVDLAVTWSNHASLITLSDGYAAASTDAQRAGYVAAANYASSVLASRLQPVYSIVDLSFAIFVMGLVMLKGVFSKTTAYLGLATGVFGFLSITGFLVTVVINATLATVWLFFVGYRLYRLGQLPLEGGD